MHNQPNKRQKYYTRYTDPYYLSRYGIKEDEVEEMTHIKHIKHIYPEILTSDSWNERNKARKRHSSRTHSVKSSSLQSDKYTEESFATESSLRSTSTAHGRIHRSHSERSRKSERSHRSSSIENTRKNSPQRSNNKPQIQRRKRNSEYSSENERKTSPKQNKNDNSKYESECFQTDGSILSKQSEKVKRNGSHVVFDNKSLNSVSSLKDEDSDSTSLLSQSSESQSIRRISKMNSNSGSPSKAKPIRSKTQQKIMNNESDSLSSTIKKEDKMNNNKDADVNKKIKNRVEFILDDDIFFQKETQGSSEKEQKQSKFICQRKNKRFLQQKRSPKREVETQCHRLIIDKENAVEYHSSSINQESEPKNLHLLIDQENKVEYHSSLFDQYRSPIVDQDSKVEYQFDQAKTNNDSKEELIKNEQEITNDKSDQEDLIKQKEEQKINNNNENGEKPTKQKEEQEITNDNDDKSE